MWLNPKEYPAAGEEAEALLLLLGVDEVPLMLLLAPVVARGSGRWEETCASGIMSDIAL